MGRDPTRCTEEKRVNAVGSGREREPLLAGGLPTQYVDVDPEETGEWLDSFDALVEHAGPYRARYIMLSLLRRVYGAIVIDMSSYLNDINLAFLDASDVIVEIVTYDSTTIHNTVAIADTFRSIGYPASKVRYLVNRADSPGGIDPIDLERAIGRVPEHRVVSDGLLVIQSNNEGVPFVLANPDAAISRDVMRVAGEVLNAGRVATAAGRS